MNKTRLSSKGQVIIPKSSRVSHHWEPGQELLVIDTEDGVLLKSVPAVPATTLDDVAGCLACSGPARSLDDMQQAIQKGANQVREQFATDMDDHTDDKY